MLVKTKEPKIEWRLATRSGDDLTEFLVKANVVAHDIAACRFYKRPAKWCSYCDFLRHRRRPHAKYIILDSLQIAETRKHPRLSPSTSNTFGDAGYSPLDNEEKTNGDYDLGSR